MIYTTDMTDRDTSTTIDELGAMLEHIVEHMATKQDVADIIDGKLEPIEMRLAAVESKIDGINRRLDSDAMQRADLKLPQRTSDLETQVFGAARAPLVDLS